MEVVSSRSHSSVSEHPSSSRLILSACFLPSSRPPLFWKHLNVTAVLVLKWWGRSGHIWTFAFGKWHFLLLLQFHHLHISSKQFLLHPLSFQLCFNKCKIFTSRKSSSVWDEMSFGWPSDGNKPIKSAMNSVLGARRPNIERQKRISVSILGSSLIVIFYVYL